MLTLYHHPRSRSTRIMFLLEELGVAYSVKRVEIRKRDGGGALDPVNPHPHGKVPAISDGGELVFESPAIALYLTDKFPDRGLGPRVGDPGRGAYLTWLCYYSGVFEPAFVSKFMQTEVPRGTAGWVAVEEVMPAVLAQLAHGQYLLGEHFSAADVLYGTAFALFSKSPLLPKSAVIEEYVQRIVARPAYARALAKEGA